jgi:hypothetical protein
MSPDSHHHERLNFEAAVAFRRVVGLIPKETPIILETPVPEGMLNQEVQMAQSIMERQHKLTGLVEC